MRGADVVVEATRLGAPEPLLHTEWISPGALVVPYGTVSAVGLDLLDIMDKIVVDDWGQAGRARSARCARTSTQDGCPRPTCMPSSARSCAAPGPAGSTMPSGSCSGTAGSA